MKRKKRYFRTEYGLHSFVEAYSWVFDDPPERVKLAALLAAVYGVDPATWSPNKHHENTQRYYRTPHGLIGYKRAQGWLAREKLPRANLAALLLVVFGETGSLPPGAWPNPPEGTVER